MRTQIILLLTVLAWDVGHSQVKNPMPMPELQTIGQGVVWRTSQKQDEHCRYLPPWKEIKITNIFEFKRRPATAAKVTIVPLAVNISPLDLKILKVEKKENACEGLPAGWGVELEPIQLKEFFEIAPTADRAAEFPFDVAVLYPAVKYARQIKKEHLARANLPKGVALNTVKAALDLTADGKPDVVIVEYCCDDTKKRADGCDYTCGKTFKRVPNTWKLVDT